MEENKKISNEIKGKVFAATGDLDYFPEPFDYPKRTELRIFVEKCGGIFSSSVTKKTDYLICNNYNSYTDKFENAIKSDVTIITEAEFLGMAGCKKINGKFCLTTANFIKLNETDGLKQYISKDGECILPETVTSIDDSEFKYCKTLKNITIPASVKSIGKEAFFGCENLKKVVIEKGLNSIGESAFSGCKMLSEINLPNSIKTIEKKAFKDCTALEKIEIPGSVKTINYGILDSSGVREVVLHSGVRFIDSHGFIRCYLDKVTLPDTVEFWDDAFEYNNFLRLIVFTGSKIKADKGDFKRIKKAMVISEDLSIVPDYFLKNAYEGFFEYYDQFSDESRKQYIEVIKNSLSKYLEKLFSKKEILNFIFENDYLGEKEYHIFLDEAISRKDVDLINKLYDYRKKHEEKFCAYYKKTVARQYTKYAQDTDTVSFLCSNNLIKPEIYNDFSKIVLDINNHESNAIVLDYRNKIKDKLEKIEKKNEEAENIIIERAFSRINRDGIKGLNIAVVGKLQTFDNVEDFKKFLEKNEASFSSSITAKTDCVIINDINDTSQKARKARDLGIEIFNEIEFNTLLKRCFVLNKNLAKLHYKDEKDVILSDYTAAIQYEAFMDNETIESIYIPKGLKYIEEHAFLGCKNFKNITIEDISSWCNIDLCKYSFPSYQKWNLYYNGELLKELIVPSDVKTIKPYTFYHRCSIEKITLPSSVTKIERTAFAYSGLKEITIPPSVKEIKSSAFDGCYSLCRVNISDLKAWCKIKFDSYYSNPLCYAKNLYLNGELLTCLELPEDISELGYVVESWGSSSFYSYAFCNCKSITSIKIPASLKLIGIDAFKGCKNIKSIYISDLKSWCGINPGYCGLNHHGKLYLNGKLLTECKLYNKNVDKFHLKM